VGAIAITCEKNVQCPVSRAFATTQNLLQCLKTTGHLHYIPAIISGTLIKSQHFIARNQQVTRAGYDTFT
jgi:hypothetical protein